jgi:hypothetical protein
LQAHNHNYQRTYPLNFNQTRAFTPVITDRDPERYEYDPKRPIFITVGTGGEDLYNFTGQAPFVVNGKFYENRENTDKDHFTIKK